MLLVAVIITVSDEEGPGVGAGALLMSKDVAELIRPWPRPSSLGAKILHNEVVTILR
jgi:hypothetical protein